MAKVACYPARMAMVEINRIAASLTRWRDDIVEFARLLIRTPSISGSEAQLAQLVAERMRELRFDEVAID
ncbi:MAG: hypothetical protein HY692_07080, partial [Cyanobacteria bacterium NC_groundwater_1444_Ag_S-0.65um_54_12]|nr:hypothetical protein [Cyanobacteria bacterium NC_groundwater_1444_Ag_S-0.65um_54_12]